MAFNPENSAIRVDAALEEKLKGASFEEIKAHLANAAVEQRLVVPDVYDNSVLIPTELASAAPKRFAKAVVVNGVKHILEGHSRLELEKAESAFYREQFQQPHETTLATEQARNERGQFVTAEDAAAKAELELAFKRGDISASDYLQQSGAVADYLDKAGVPLEDLKASVAEKQGQKFEQGWADATEAFKARHPEWIGGDANRDIIGKIIADNNLVDSEDKLAALESAYDHARENGLLVANPQTETHDRIANARTAEEIREAASYRYSTSTFGR